MAQINKHTVILKDKSRGIAGIVVLTETGRKISARLSVNLPKGPQNLILVLCGLKLPFTLLDFGKAGSVNSSLEFISEEICGGDISAMLIKRNASVSENAGYGYCGKDPVSAESILKSAEKRLLGAKIVSPQEDVKIEYKEKADNEEEAVDYEKEYARLVTDDPYIKEDTTLSDIDIIAEENYFEKENENESGRQSEAPVSQDTAFTIEDKEKNTEAEPQENDIGIAAEELRNAGESFNYEKFTGGTVYAKRDFAVKDLPEAEEKDFKIYEKKVTGFKNYNYDDEEEFEGMEYYEKVKNKLFRLLTENEKDTVLCSLIPESDFSRITYDSDKFYCVGLVRENGVPAYICYGVPGYYSDTAPEEFEGCSKWIPEDPKDPKNKGYWMMFQNVTDGKCIKG